MSSEFDAEAAAKRARGEEPTTTTHARAEGIEPDGDVGSTSTLRDMLLSTDPAKPLDQVESPYDPDRGGVTRIYRGLQKATGIDGMPAVVDMAIGVVEFMQVFQVDDETVDDQDDAELNDDQGAVI